MSAFGRLDAEGQRAIAIHGRPEFLLPDDYASVSKERIKYGLYSIMNLDFWCFESQCLCSLLAKDNTYQRCEI